MMPLPRLAVPAGCSRPPQKLRDLVWLTGWRRAVSSAASVRRSCRSSAGRLRVARAVGSTMRPTGHQAGIVGCQNACLPPSRRTRPGAKRRGCNYHALINVTPTGRRRGDPRNATITPVPRPGLAAPGVGHVLQMRPHTSKYWALGSVSMPIDNHQGGRCKCYLLRYLIEVSGHPGCSGPRTFFSSLHKAARKGSAVA